MSTTSSSPSGDLWGHPKGLYICFATELWERFSFYGMKYLLLLYLTKYHLFSDAAGLGVLGSYASLVYAMPVLGGLVADRFIGMRKAVTFGGALLVLGHLGMAVEGDAARQTADGIVRDDGALSIFYLSLALIVVGGRLSQTQHIHGCWQALPRGRCQTRRRLHHFLYGHQYWRVCGDALVRMAR